MFVFRDESMLKRIQINKTIEQHAQQQLFVSVEYILRKVIQEARKYQIHFRQKQLTSQFVDMAIKDLNYDKCDVLGFQYMDTINLTKTQSEHILNDQSQDLKDLISYQFRTLRIPIGHPQIIFFNVLHNQQMINSPETQQLLQQREIMNLDIKQQQEEKKSFNIVRDNIISILSPHQQDILKSFQQTFKQEIISLQLSCQPQFVQCILFSQIQFLSIIRPTNFQRCIIIIAIYNLIFISAPRGLIIIPIQKKKSNHILLNKYYLESSYQLRALITCIYQDLIQLFDILHRGYKYCQHLINIKLGCIQSQINYRQIFNQIPNAQNKFEYTSSQQVRLIIKLRYLIISKGLFNNSSIFFYILPSKYYIFQSIEPVHQQIIQSIANILKQIYENQNMINGHAIKQKDDDQLYHIQYQIELQLNQMLIKIMDGLKYLLPENQQQFWVIIQNCVELLKALGREESLLILIKHSENIIL